jgi:hypothetical protein
MIGLLVYVLIVLVIFGAIFYAIMRAPNLDPPIRTVAYLVVLVIFILVMLGLIGVIPGWSPIARPL